MRSILLIFILEIYTLTALAAGNLCLSNWDETNKKIKDLQNEVICTNSENLSDCYNILFDKSVPGPSESLVFSRLDQVDCQCGVDDLFRLTNSQGWITAPVLELAKHFADAGSDPTKRHFINSAEEFYLHMQLHRERVVALGVEAYKKNPKLFPNLTIDEVKGILASHDLAKVDLGTVASNKKSFYRVLYNEGYGKKLDPKWVKELNVRDEAFMREAYERYGATVKSGMNIQERQVALLKKDQILKIEKIADLVDRVNSRVSEEEFGRKMFPVKNNISDKEYRSLIKYLEKDYQKITAGFGFKPLTPDEFIRLHQTLRRKEFLYGLSHKGYRNLSVNALKSMVKFESKNALEQVASFLAKKSIGRVVSVANGVGLFFSDMERLGCDENGQFDWIKEDGVCRPIIGLTPKFVNYLFLPEEEQKLKMKSYLNQCEVVNKSSEFQKVDRFLESKCLSDGIRVVLPKGRGILTLRTREGRLASIIHESSTSNSPIHIKTEIVYDENLNEKDICFFNRSISQRSCGNKSGTSQFGFGLEKEIQGTIHKSVEEFKYHLLRTMKECQSKS